jgi:hypothetical protein
MTRERKPLRAARTVRALAACLALAAMPAPAEERPEQAGFAAALADVEANRLRSARRRLEVLVAGNPSLLRARLELARVCYLQRDYAAARAEANRVLAEPDLPAGVRTTVLAFLAQLDADEARYAARHQVVGTLYAGAVYDTNVNVGPNRDVIDIAGDSFLIDPADRETADVGVVLTPGVTHTYNPGRRFAAGEQTGFAVWQSQASAYYRAYADESDFNLGVLTARTGPAWIVPGRWRAGLGVQADQVFLGQDGLALFGTVNPNVAWQLGQDTELRFDGIATQRIYQGSDNEGRDGWFRLGSVALTRYLAQRRVGLQAGLGYAGFDADAEFLTYEGPEAFVGFIAQAWRRGTVYARAGYRRYDFEGREPVFDEPRDDDEYRLIAGFNHDLVAGPLAGWAVQGAWTWTRNDSSIPIYEFDRQQVNLGLARSF